MNTLLLTSHDTWQNLFYGYSEFIELVVDLMGYILGSATLSIAFAAGFAFLAVRLIKKLKRV